MARVQNTISENRRATAAVVSVDQVALGRIWYGRCCFAACVFSIVASKATLPKSVFRERLGGAQEHPAGGNGKEKGGKGMAGTRNSSWFQLWRSGPRSELCTLFLKVKTTKKVVMEGRNIWDNLEPSRQTLVDCSSMLSF